MRPVDVLAGSGRPAGRESSSRDDGPQRPRPLLWAVRKYFRIFRTSLIERMAYRGDFFLSTILRFLPMVTTILLWQAVYAGAAKDRVAGFKYSEMVAYLLLVHISRMFSSMPGLAFGITRDIREGTLKKYLIQPLDMIAYLVSYRAAHKAAYIATSALPYALLFFLCREFFKDLPGSLTVGTVAGYLLSLVLGFLVGFFFETTMGIIGFWFLEVTSLLYVVNTVNFFVSGQMFPLELLPGPVASVLRMLPFQYLAYFPAAVLVGKVRDEAMIKGLVVEVAWVVGLFLLSRWLFRAGLRRYSAYGG